MRSLRARLLAAASVVLIVFVVVTGTALSEAHTEQALVAQQERMQGLVYSLLGAADVGPAGEFSLYMEELGEARFRQPDSELNGAVFDADGALVWLSPSAVDAPPPSRPHPVGTPIFTPSESEDTPFRLDYSVLWYGEGEEAFGFTFSVREHATAFFMAERAFKRDLWLWLLVPAALLLLTQLLVLVWALRPLRRMESDIKQLESGHSDQVATDYPTELMPLSRALNALLTAEKSRRQRYMDALSNLSHSLKTPLAAARSLVANPASSTESVDDQLGRMDRIIRFQLTRASAEAPGLLSASVKVAPVLERLHNTLSKVHGEKQLKFELNLDANCTSHVAEDALFEMLGNVFDNACKWAEKEVRVGLSCEEIAAMVVIEDDGPGFPDEDIGRWLERGARADRERAGQGIGLAVCHDMLRVAGGRLELGRSDLGGAKVVAHLPE